MTSGLRKELVKVFRFWCLWQMTHVEIGSLMDQLVDTGSRTVEGMAAMNGEMIRKMGAQNPGMG